MNKKKKKILATITALTIMSYSYEHHYTPTYEIVMEKTKAFARYSNGLVYIGNKDYLLELNNLNEGDVLILDERDNIDPNIRIYSSYLINDKNIRNEILEIILQYEKMYPSNWKRSIDSMRIEWFIHNFLHFFNYENNRTTDVDLNNNDEEKYNVEIIKRLVKI